MKWKAKFCYNSSGTGIIFCPVLVTLESKWSNKPVVLSRGRKGEDLNFVQNAFNEVYSFANQEASCSFKMSDLLEMD